MLDGVAANLIAVSQRLRIINNVTKRFIPVLAILIALWYGWREVQQGQLAYRPPNARNALISPSDAAGSGRLMLSVNVPAEVLVDHLAPRIVPGGRPFGLSLEPGTHSVVVKADGYLEQEFTLVLKAGETVERTIDLPPLPANPPTLVEPKDFVRAVQTAKDGASIALRAGEYRLPRGLTVARSITLIGAGQDKTRIVSDGEIFVLKFDSPGSFTARDVSFAHDGTIKADVVVIENGHFNFERCGFSGGIRNPEESATTGDGLWVRGTTRGRVLHSAFVDNGLHGLEVQGSANLTVESNTFERNKEDGLVFFDDTTGTVRANTSRDNGLHGISVAENADVSLQANILEQNTEVGLRYSGSAGGTASLNVIRKNSLSGITLNDSARPTLTGNVLRDNGSYGLYIAKNARPTINANSIKGNAKGAIEDLRPPSARR